VSATTGKCEEGGVKPPLHGQEEKNVGAPTFKVLLEGFGKEFVFRDIGDFVRASFQNGNGAAWMDLPA
jgi:hypothetical protein